MRYTAVLLACFLCWTLWSYCFHAFAHSRSAPRWLRHVHAKHHAYHYGPSLLPTWYEFFFWFGNWRSSIDVWLTFTAPVVVLSVVVPSYGLPLLAFHYLYELFLARNVLEHNPRVCGRITRLFAFGAYHLAHHRDPHCNFGFFITLWDRVFRTIDSVTTNPAAGHRS